MKNRLLALVCMIVISTLLVACAGTYLKYEILMPVGLFQDKHPVEVTFAVLTDPAARFALQKAKELKTETLPAPETIPPADIPIKPTETVMREEESPAELPSNVISENWFDDVLFIGDSRTVGLRDYARLGKADYFCSVGLTVFDVTTQQLSDYSFSSTDLQSLLQSKRYNKIYISLGLNEAGSPYALLMEAYDLLLDMVREEQPHAVIVLQGLITVSRQKAASEQHFSLENLQIINAGIRDFADGHRIHYIDANEYFADAEGYLPDELTFDGCHFYASGYEAWAQWILDNAKTLNISFG